MNTDDLKRLVGLRLKQAREDLGLSQTEVAEMLGLAQTSYAHIESGRNRLSIEHLRRLPKILYKPVNYFLDLEVEVSDDEAEILEMYRALPDEPSRRWVRESLLSLVETIRRSSSG